MKKLFIISIVIASLIISGYFIYSNISLIPHDLLEILRTFRDTVQQISKSAERTAGVPLNAKIYDSDFIVEEFVTGLKQPTSMTFVGSDILILENPKEENLQKNG